MRAIAKIIYGSDNYCLNGPDSDKDYKILLAPEFIDMYRMKKTNKSDVPFGYDPDHTSVMDVRKFDTQLRNCNPNAIELLFSIDFNLYDKAFSPYFDLAREAYAKGFVAYRWKEFFAAAKGLVLNTLRRGQDSEASRLKAASRAWYWANFVYRIVTKNFVIDEDTWRNPVVWRAPRIQRFENVDIVPLSIEDWEQRFDAVGEAANKDLMTYVSARAQTTLRFATQACYDNAMELCMQGIIGKALKDELEERYA